jgi:predicted CoA-substrate-specific enzyme activase
MHLSSSGQEFRALRKQLEDKREVLVVYLGVDIGSSSSKAALVDEAANVLGSKVVNIGTGTNGIDLVLNELYQETGISRKEIRYSVVTGYGRMTYPDADTQITEITCHARGVATIYPQAGSIIDIGGQDAKVIRLNDRGRVENFVMNEKCAAGTGRFFEVMARVLNCSLSELDELASTETVPVHISSVCTVFAESEVISQLASGASRQAVAKGAHIAVAQRIAGLCNRLGMKDQVVITGGVALNRSIVKALEDEIGYKILRPENPQIMGALGAAYLARERYHRLNG